MAEHDGAIEGESRSVAGWKMSDRGRAGGLREPSGAVGLMVLGGAEGGRNEGGGSRRAEVE